MVSGSERMSASASTSSLVNSRSRRRFVSMIGRGHAGATLEQRAKRIGAGELPQAPSRGMMI